MARIPNIAFTVLATRRGNAAVAHHFTTSEGVLLADGSTRAILPDAMATFLEALVRVGVCQGALKGHGVRLLTAGKLSPCFIERSGAAGGTVYLYGSPSNSPALAEKARATLGEGCSIRAVTKGGVYVTLPATLDDATADAFATMCLAHGSPGAGDGWVDGMTQPATPIEAPKVELEGVQTETPKESAKARKERRQAERKGAKPSATAESETAHIRAAG